MAANPSCPICKRFGRTIVEKINKSEEEYSRIEMYCNDCKYNYSIASSLTADDITRLINNLPL